MFENKSFENILSEMLAAAPEGIDTSCGSIFYDAAAPVAAELAKLYSLAARIADDVFPDSASEAALMRHASILGIEREPATCTRINAQFNVPLPEGAKFSLNEYTYTCGDVIYSGTGYYVYELTCDTAGSRPASRAAGELIPLSYIDGLTVANALSVVYRGTDEEETDALRGRIATALTNVSYGGNKADYINTVKAVEGVGGVKVHPAFNGGGTVKVVLQAVGGGKPSAYLISKVKSLLDPDMYTGEGAGVAPVGHKVTVTGAEEYPVSVETKLTFADGWNSETAAPYVADAVKAYVDFVSSRWEATESPVLRISQLESYILASGCVDDVTNTKFYSETEGAYVAANLPLDEDHVPVFKEVTVV